MTISIELYILEVHRAEDKGGTILVSVRTGLKADVRILE